jgi:hypothetical protein
MNTRSIVAALAFLPACGSFAQSTPPTGDTGQVISTAAIRPAAGDKPGDITTADQLLTALETADRSIRTLKSSITHYKRESELVGNRVQQWNGKLAMRVDPPAPGSDIPRRLVQIDFADLIVDGTRRDDPRTFIFDGQWLLEKQPTEKQIFKRQVCPPDKIIDPLALGEGQFPIPIGQKKDRINERFEAALVPPEQDFPQPPGADPDKPAPLPAWVKDSYQLHLIPKPGNAAFRNYREIRVWYRKGDLLPRMARALNIDDSADEVILSQVELNQPLPSGLFDMKIPDGWNAEISEFRAPVDDK